MKVRFLMLGAALALAACGPRVATDPPPSPVPPVAGVIAKADAVILTGERGFAVAELAYTTAANGVGRLVDAGFIRGTTATQVRAWNAEARALLVRGKAAADAAERARVAARIFGLADNLNTVLGAR